MFFCSVLHTMRVEDCHCIGSRKSSILPCNVKNTELVTTMKKPSLRTLWRKIKMEKRKFLTPSPAVHFHYDPSSYQQNFDDGYSTDPDNASRSFSARFAVPSKVFDKGQMVGDEDKDKTNNV